MRLNRTKRPVLLPEFRIRFDIERIRIRIKPLYTLNLYCTS